MTVDERINSDETRLKNIAQLLPRYAYRMADEKLFQDGLSEVLNLSGIAHQREYVAGPRDRFDFFVDGGIVLEAKVKGSLPAALNQIDRYAAREDVKAVVLVTTKYWGAASSVRQLRGKPVYVVKVRGAAF
ncbi:hypothetical protein [Pseudoduganella sp. R-34]|uniref:hypothetical protein n=1 Tax=Pseudoduganella sp. R-34 TaxID=3404062 RepID=UPI003CF26AB2